MIRKRPLVKVQIALKTLKNFRFEVWQINELQYGANLSRLISKSRVYVT